jgi:hypothetical protein
VEKNFSDIKKIKVEAKLLPSGVVNNRRHQGRANPGGQPLKVGAVGFQPLNSGAQFVELLSGGLPVGFQPLKPCGYFKD